MKKIKSFIKNNVILIVGFIVGIIISGTSVYAATILLNANQVGYNNTNTDLTSTDVQGALNELYTKANTWINPIRFGMSQNRNKNVIATDTGILIRKNGQTHFIKNNNWEEEKNHLQQIFSSDFCDETSSYFACVETNGYSCFVFSDGGLTCRDQTVSGCSVDRNGSVTCD